MVQVGDTIISLDIFEKYFSCDIAICKGQCCVDGDSGAPMEKKEVRRIKDNYDNIKKYMSEAGIRAVGEQGFAVIDSDGDLVTPLVEGKECAYIIKEGDGWWCAIEKAWANGKSNFRKPISCHLYPIRITKYPEFDALNYNRWKICECAVAKGIKEKIPIYKFLKDALIEKYGTDWYKELEIIAEELKKRDIAY